MQKLRRRAGSPVAAVAAVAGLEPAGSRLQLGAQLPLAEFTCIFPSIAMPRRAINALGPVGPCHRDGIAAEMTLNAPNTLPETLLHGRRR